MTDTPHSVVSVQFWRCFWVQLRPYLFFVSGSTGLVGLSFVPGISTARFLACFFAFFLSYGLGQALTDVFQTDTDRISSPYRPLSSGKISKGAVMALSLLGLGACAAVFLWCNPWAIIFSALGVVGLVTYTPFKRRWWGGPFWNSGVVIVLPVIGYLCGEADPRIVLSNQLLWLANGSIFFSYSIFVLLGYFKDLSADRQTGYNTIPVVFGWNTGIVVSGFFCLLMIGFGLMVIARTWTPPQIWTLPNVTALFLWGLGSAFVISAHFMMWRIRREEDSHPAVAMTVRGFVLVQSGVAAWLDPALVAWALFLSIGFEAALRLRPESSQI